MILQEALGLRARGFSIIPVPLPGGGHDGKRPIIPWRDYQRRHPTDAEIRRWFTEPINAGIVCGAVSGIVVVDLDSPAAARWWVRRRPHTPWQTRTARGRPLFYRHPGVAVRNCVRLDTCDGRIAIDVRGDGGFVIAPGSLHASGARYQMAGDWGVAREELPIFCPEWLSSPERRPVAPPSPRPAGDVIERARRYLAATPLPEIGCGSDKDTLSAACRLVRGFALDTTTAETLMWEWCGGRPGWDRPWVERKVRNAERYGSEPLGGLRA